jgi:ATP-dependent DNA helicase RecG
VNEDQRTEWKLLWRDEYLKWLCGFANAQGGVLEIGRDDQGKVVGLEDAPRLLEELPSKIRDLLGIVVDIELLEEGGSRYLRIAVEPHPVPISLRGEYHYRSGSTKQVLRGAALDRFLLAKIGRRWDSAPVPGVTVGALDPAALARFRQRAALSKRLGAEALDVDDVGLLEKLRLTEGRYLKRAAVLLFHSEPECFVTGSSIKIGYFEDDTDLRYHDEIAGGLFNQVGRTMELLSSKYLKADISYEGIQRIESFPVPESALREAVVNAVVHRDYAIAAPIQIRVYGERLLIWNPGELPEGWSIGKLLKRHPSQPFNPDVANAFFRSGEIEAWGRGIQRIFGACRAMGTPDPRLNVESRGVWIEFPFSDSYIEQVVGRHEGTPERAARITNQELAWLERLGERLGEKLGERLGETEGKILLLIRADSQISTRIIAKRVGISTTAVDKALAKLKRLNILRRAGPARGGYWEILEGTDG